MYSLYDKPNLKITQKVCAYEIYTPSVVYFPKSSTEGVCVLNAAAQWHVCTQHEHPHTHVKLNLLNVSYWLCPIHRCRPESPQPAPFLSQHGAQIVCISVFPAIKITLIRQVLMYLQSKLEDKNVWKTTWHMKIVGAFCLCLFPHAWSAKTWIPPISAPWLMTPLHGVV